jgi:hypothetical protein
MHHSSGPDALSNVWEHLSQAESLDIESVLEAILLPFDREGEGMQSIVPHEVVAAAIEALIHGETLDPEQMLCLDGALAEILDEVPDEDPFANGKSEEVK